MEFIKAAKLVFDYITKDEEERVESVNRAIDHLDLDIEQGSFVAILIRSRIWLRSKISPTVASLSP